MGPNDIDLTPRGRKAQALLAMVALAKGMRRSRTWLRDRLWSDRDEAQSMGSLRSALVEIRRILGPYADALVTDGSIIALDSEKVGVAPPDPASRHELLEGMDVRDQEFEEWLRELRSVQSEQIESCGTVSPATLQPNEHYAATEPVVTLSIEDGFEGNTASLAEMVLETLNDVFVESRVLAPLDRRASSVAPMGPDPILSLVVDVRERANGQVSPRVRLYRVGDNAMVWARTLPLQVGAEVDLTPSLAGLANEAHDVTLSSAQSLFLREGGPFIAAFHMLEAIREIFDHRDSNPFAARERINAARTHRDSGVLMAWHAFTFVTQSAETNRGIDDQRTQVRDLLAAANQHDPGNPLVIAISGHVSALVLRDMRLSAHYVAEGARLMPVTAMCLALRASALCYLDQPEEGKVAALIALDRAVASPYGHFFSSISAMACALSGDFERAVELGELTMSRKPAMRANLRYLMLSYAHLGELDSAKALLSMLREVEPDFGPEVVGADTYPIVGERAQDLFLSAFKILS